MEEHIYLDILEKRPNIDIDLLVELSWWIKDEAQKVIIQALKKWDLPNRINEKFFLEKESDNIAMLLNELNTKLKTEIVTAGSNRIETLLDNSLLRMEKIRNLNNNSVSSLTITESWTNTTNYIDKLLIMQWNS